MLASSDADFVHIAQRLRERRASVLGIGEQKSKKAWRAACSEFVVIGSPPPAPKSPVAKQAGTHITDVSDMDRKIKEIIARNSQKGQGMPLVLLAPKMFRSHGVRLKNLKEKTWRSYFKARPTMYDLDPPGNASCVRFLPAGFNAKP